MKTELRRPAQRTSSAAEERLTLLRKCFLPEPGDADAETGEDVLARLAVGSRMENFLSGAVVCQDGEEACTLDIVAEGRVKLFRLAADGREIVLHAVGRGKTLDAAALFGKGRREISGQALGAVRLLRIEREAVLEAARRGGAFTLHLLEILAARQKMFINKVSGNQGRTSARCRVCGWLVHRADMEASPVIACAMTREVMAGLLGIARESLSRQLRSMEREGLIRLECGRIALLNMEELRRQKGTE